MDATGYDIMTRYEAQYQFWASFGLPVYEETYVANIHDISYPYITFQGVSAEFNNNTLINVNIWTRSESFATVTQIAEEIQRRFEKGRTIIRYNGGAFWYTAESNFMQMMGDPEDNYIKRITMTLLIHW